MCSRYEMKASPGDLAGRFHLRDVPPDLAHPDRGAPFNARGDSPARAEVRPTDPAVIVVRAEDGARLARSARFGLAVEWDRAPVINARAETLWKKPTFRPLLLNRCLIPASAYFEWRQDGRARRRNRIALEGESLMGFAGLFDNDRFVIVTCAPAAALAHVHNRMPVILSAAAEEPWLDPNTSSAALAALLAPYAGTIAAVEEKPKPVMNTRGGIRRRDPQGDLFGGG